MSKMNAYEEITNRIIASLEQGVAPWKQGWGSSSNYSGLPKNFTTGKAYRGVNVMVLLSEAYHAGYNSPYWMTYKQAQKIGAQVRKKQNATPIVFWNFKEIEEEDGTKKTIPILRKFNVFNACQIDGLPEGAFPTKTEPKKVHEVIERAEEICNGYEGPTIEHGGNRAYYSPNQDHIQLPGRDQFHTPESYYSTRFHEMIHSTGHSTRLKRSEVTEPTMFGSHDYSREELVAELGAAFLSAEAGISPSTLENSTAYIQGWLKALKNDVKMIVWASGRAQKAADYVLGLNKSQ